VAGNPRTLVFAASETPALETNPRTDANENCRASRQ
jgi:hypothetical protein